MQKHLGGNGGSRHGFLSAVALLSHRGWFVLPSSAQPAVAPATASVWSPAARCMWRMKTMSTAISLCPAAPGRRPTATCLVTWSRARRLWSGGLESGGRWARASKPSVVSFSSSTVASHVNGRQTESTERPSSVLTNQMQPSQRFTFAHWWLWWTVTPRSSNKLQLLWGVLWFCCFVCVLNL